MEPDWETFIRPPARGLRVPGRLHIVYQEHGGPLQQVQDRRTPREYRIVDPRTGNVTATGRLVPGEAAKEDASPQARVIIFHGPPE